MDRRAGLLIFQRHRFTFGDELHIEPRRGIGGFAVDPEFGETFVYGVILQLDGEVRLTVPAQIVDSDLFAALIPAGIDRF